MYTVQVQSAAHFPPFPLSIHSCANLGAQSLFFPSPAAIISLFRPPLPSFVSPVFTARQVPPPSPFLPTKRAVSAARLRRGFSSLILRCVPLFFPPLGNSSPLNVPLPLPPQAYASGKGE